MGQSVPEHTVALSVTSAQACSGKRAMRLREQFEVARALPATGSPVNAVAGAAAARACRLAHCLAPTPTAPMPTCQGGRARGTRGVCSIATTIANMT